MTANITHCRFLKSARTALRLPALFSSTRPLLALVMLAAALSAFGQGTTKINRTVTRTLENHIQPLFTSFTYTDLYDFGTSGGYFPANYAPLAIAIDANFYGATTASPSPAGGTLFNVAANGTGYTDVVPNWGLAGDYEQGGVTYVDPYLYGATQINGAFGYGSVFRSTTTGTVKVLHNFDSTEQGGKYPPVLG